MTPYQAGLALIQMQVTDHGAHRRRQASTIGTRGASGCRLAFELAQPGASARHGRSLVARPVPWCQYLTGTWPEPRADANEPPPRS